MTVLTNIIYTICFVWNVNIIIYLLHAQHKSLFS